MQSSLAVTSSNRSNIACCKAITNIGVSPVFEFTGDNLHCDFTVGQQSVYFDSLKTIDSAIFLNVITYPRHRMFSSPESGIHLSACVTCNILSAIEFPVPPPQVVYPPRQELLVKDWPEGLLLQLPCVTQITGVYKVTWYLDESRIVPGPGFRSVQQHIDGLVQERRNSIANALELRLPCTTHRYEQKYFGSQSDWHRYSLSH